jgi:hypothetical protein
LDRQVSLLAYLTSSAAIFGNEAEGRADPAFAGCDLRLLQLEARFSHEKRMEKIAGVFSRTLELLGDEQAQVVRTFAERCPSVSIGRIENARQFHDFLTGFWRFRPPHLPYLADVAACELAFAEARNWEGDAADAVSQGTQPHAGSVRRHPGVALQQCEHDVQPMFEGAGLRSAPVERETFLAFAAPGDASSDVRVFDLDPTVFALLSALSAWTPRSGFGDTEEADALIGELVSHGLLEAAP